MANLLRSCALICAFISAQTFAAWQSWDSFAKARIAADSPTESEIHILEKFGEALAKHGLDIFISRLESDGVSTAYYCQLRQNSHPILSFKIGDISHGQDWGHHGKLLYDFSDFLSADKSLSASLLTDFVTSLSEAPLDISADAPKMAMNRTLQYFLAEGRLASLGLGYLYDKGRKLNHPQVILLGYLNTDISLRFAVNIDESVIRKHDGTIYATGAIFNPNEVYFMRFPYGYNLSEERSVVAKAYPNSSGASGFFVKYEDIHKARVPVYTGGFGNFTTLADLLAKSQAEPLKSQSGVAQTIELIANLNPNPDASVEFIHPDHEEGESYADNFVGPDANIARLISRLRTHRLALKCEAAL